MPEYKLAVNEANKATELPLCRVCGSVEQNPHMRAFWAATVSFFLAFLGWFALSPLALDVAHSMKICENQKFPPADYRTRKAYVTFKNLKTEKKYCRYGAKDDDSDCLPGPMDMGTNETEEVGMYAPEVLTKCVCTDGTECLDVAHSMKICENQKFPPDDYPSRKAYVTFKNPKTEEEYCIYGAREDEVDCYPVPADVNDSWGPYALEVLTKCVCTDGTECLDMAHSMKICENQKFPPADYPTRKAYVTFNNLKTEKKYCRYGAKDDDSDCLPAPMDKQGMYAPEVLTKCVCTGGTECRTVLGDAGVASVASTIFVRVALGTLLERFGPVNVQTGIMTYGAFWVAVAAAISAPWNFILIRFFIGAAGATFVTNQFWCSLMFAPNVVGTANATAAGWGNLGGGVTQFFMVIFLFNPFVSAGLEENVAWRVSMLVPALLFLLIAVTMKLLCWDTPTARRFDPVVDTGKSKGASLMDYVEVLKDKRVLVMIFQYSACFGTELAMNNQLATHFRTYFQMKAAEASLLASAFGLMNLFARSLGGIGSDLLFKFVGFRGRIWAQFLALFFEAVFLFGFGLVDNSQPWGVALAVLVCFSLFVQMAEGTSYGIVPFMSKTQLACVSAVVGAGGNLGAVIVGFLIYRPIEDPLLPFQVHAGYVMFWALLSPLYYWPEYGGMFCGPKEGSKAEENNA